MNPKLKPEHYSLALLLSAIQTRVIQRGSGEKSSNTCNTPLHFKGALSVLDAE
jgi:hypothetical protein